MHTTTPHFIHLCRLLIQEIEAVPVTLREPEREHILDQLMSHLMQEGLVFDRAFAGVLFDQLQGEPDPVLAGSSSEAHLNQVRERVLHDEYFTDAVLQTLGDRMLYVLGNSS